VVAQPTKSAAAAKDDGFAAFVAAPSQSKTAPTPGGVNLGAALTPSAEQQKSSILNLFNTPAPAPSFVASPYGAAAPQPGGYHYGYPQPGYPGAVYAPAGPYGYTPYQPQAAPVASYPPASY